MLEFNFSPFPVLETKRLKLRGIERKDAEAWYEMKTHPEDTKYSKRFPPKSMDEIYELVEKVKAGTAANQTISWVITLKENDACIGMISFHKTYPEHHRAEIGYSLSWRYWRQGLMSEAIEAAVAYAFDTMKLHSIEAHTNPLNVPSMTLLEKSGFVLEAHFKENFYFDGNFFDSKVFSLLNKK